MADRLPMAGGPAIATRVLTLLPGGRPVRVEIDPPARRGTGAWSSAYRIRGLGKVRVGHGRGADSLEALQAALAAVGRELEPFAPRLTWKGEAGELGLPAPVPDDFGGDFRRRLERLIQVETARETRRLRALGGLG